MIREALGRATLALAPRPGEPLGRVRGAALRLALRALLGRVHLRDLLALLDRAPLRPGAAEDAPAAVRGLRRWRATCLDRALAGYALLRARGEPARLVIGVDRTGGELRAHAWLERHGAPLAEPGDPRARYAVVFVHPADAAEPREEKPMAPLRSSPDVLLTELQDGTGVLLDLGTKFYFALNRTGVAAWKAIASGSAASDEIVGAIVARFAGATPEQVRPDVEALLRELRAEGLVREEPAAP